MPAALLKSLLLHALLLSSPLWLSQCGGEGNGDSDKGKAGQHAGGSDDKIRPKEEAAEENQEVEVTLVHIDALKKKKKVEEHECPGDKWYGGIGVVESYNNAGEVMIAEAVPGYPAAMAGLEAGDVFLTSTGRIRGEPGTIADLTVRKPDGSIVSYNIVRAKICTF